MKIQKWNLNKFLKIVCIVKENSTWDGNDSKNFFLKLFQVNFPFQVQKEVAGLGVNG
jgi:hypothetical protein